jgi:TATA-binding protein-associated factor
MVDLSPVQSLLYSAFASSPASEGVKRAISTAETETGGATTVLSALQYLRKVCNHPLLALMPDHPLKAEAERLAAASGATLSSIAVAPKLVALKQILEECGIGASDAPSEGADDAVGSAPAAIASHRALVFAQSSLMLDRVEQDLLTPHLPSVAHLRLDGRVPAARRGELVERFNSDPSIDLMLLTTSVGGLGLNLTSADTVIFLDHDWNPMKDLQAMDRAHRLGQRRSVSVFRLITRGTLEEKIMSLQRFKVRRHEGLAAAPQRYATPARPPLTLSHARCMWLGLWSTRTTRLCSRCRRMRCWISSSYHPSPAPARPPPARARVPRQAGAAGGCRVC